MPRFNRSRLPQRSLATRYLLVAAGFLTAILLLFSLLQVYRNYRQDLIDLEYKSAIQGSFLASVSVEHILTNNFFVLERLVRQIHSDPDVVYAVILDHEGRALTRFVDIENASIAAARAEGGSRDILTLIEAVRATPLVEQRTDVIELEGAHIGQVLLGYTRKGVRDRLIASAGTTFLATLIMIVLLSVLTFVVFRWLIGRRLRAVGIAAERYARGDFEERVPKTAPDEIGRLSVAFNHMADQLEETLAGLQNANREVEEANQALRASEAEARKLSQVASRTSNMVIISDADGHVEWVNDAFCRVTGYSLEEIIGKHPGDVLQGPETDPSVVKYMSTRLRAHQPFNCEIVNYDRNGSQYWVDIDVQPVYDKNDRLVNFIAVETDITERKRAEQVLHERIQLVSMMSEVSAEFISCPADEIDDKIGVVLERVGRQLNLDYVSLEIFDTEHEESISAHSIWTDEALRPYLADVKVARVDRDSQWSHALDADRSILVSPATTTELPSTVVRRLNSAAFRTMFLLPIFWGGRRRGQLVIGMVFSERDWAKDLVSAVEVVADIFASALQRKEFDNALETERLALRQRTSDLRIANVALAEASLAKDAFWATMSHELRTPLNAILGYTQIMERDATLSAQQADHLSVIESSGSHLLDLINDVLSLSKVEAGRMTLTPSDFDLLDLLKTLDRMFRPRMEKKRLRFTIAQPPDLPRHVHADDGKLRQVLLNLLENALKFTDDGSVTLRVGYKRASSRLCFAVEDTGVGIDADEVDQLFDLFGQTRSGRQSGMGTGLGLALSRQFVGMMGGDIQVSSQEGQGSTFSFEIEVEIVEHAPADDVMGERRILGLSSGQPAYRVLVAEDMETNQHLLDEILTDAGFSVRFADDGRQALQIAAEWLPDLVLMDLRMPEMDGYEATRRLRQDSRFADLPIVAVTASALDHQQHLAYQAGCTDVLYKPIQIESLLQMIARHIDAEYRYDDETETVPPALDPSEPAAPLSFERLPADLRRRLYDAAVLLDTDQLVTLTHEARRHDAAAAESMHTLIESFEFEPIIEAATAEPMTNANT